MPSRIADQAKYCYYQAENCVAVALHPTTSHVARQQHIDLHEKWLELARHYELAEKVSAQLEWVAKRPDPVFDPPWETLR